MRGTYGVVRPGDRKGSIMYEPSRNLFSFHIAGFQHHDGALVLGDLKAGNALELVPERSPWHYVRAAVFVRDAR